MDVFFTFLRIFIKRYSQKDCNTNIRIADETFSNNVKMLAALAFVPLNDVINAFDAVVAQMPEQLDPIIDYFENNYIGLMHRRERRPPRFPLELWNVNNRVEEEIPKTNNHVEAYHRHLQTAILSFHPNEPFGLGRFATDHSLTKAASRPLFARVRRYAPQRDH